MNKEQMNKERNKIIVIHVVQAILYILIGAAFLICGLGHAGEITVTARVWFGVLAGCCFQNAAYTLAALIRRLKI